MELVLTRFDKSPRDTVGLLHVDGAYECFMIEDTVRVGPKVYGETAIPAGTYEVVLDHSPHFGKVLPRLLNVPGFKGIRIHTGNTAEDSLGCLIVGKSHVSHSGVVGSSRIAFAALMAKLEACTEKITIDIKDGEL